MNPKSPQQLAADAASIALPYLVEQAGGEVKITEAEYEAFAKRYGGARKLALETSYAGTTLVLKLIHAPERPPVS